MARHEFVSLDIEKCVGCRVCEYICSMEKNKSFNPTRSRIRVVRLYPYTNAAINCRLCENAPCVAACPRNALTQSEENGVIHVDDERCNGCGWCIKACDFGAILLEPEKVVRMCDLCATRVEGPACIEWCPEEALKLASSDLLSQQARINTAQRLAEAADDSNGAAAHA